MLELDWVFVYSGELLQEIGAEFVAERNSLDVSLAKFLDDLHGTKDLSEIFRQSIPTLSLQETS